MKNIVITGATSGLGKELVHLFSKNCNVFAGYRNKDLIPVGVNADYFYIDLCNSSSIADAAEYIKSKVQKIDVLINAAGCVNAGPVEYVPVEKLRQQFEVNTFSHIDFTQKLLPLLENGRIVNISSMASFGHFPFISPYCASKRALDIFFNSLLIENHNNIKVISIKPGVIETPIWEKSVAANFDILQNCAEYEKELEFLKNNALKNSHNGMNVHYVAGKIKKIALSNNPKTSYTLGLDAKFAQILSYFPQDIINNLVKFGMKSRINKRRSG